MPKHIEQRGFFKYYDKPVNKLMLPVEILPTMSEDKQIQSTLVELKALWDTGATKTCMRPSIRERLKLRIFRLGDQVTLAGIGGNSVKADFTIMSIYLTNNFVVEDCPVYTVDLPKGIDIIIGMDIIGMGDFAISNVDGFTSFSFVIPSFPGRINFVEKINITNAQRE